ncbi:VanW family protein [Bacillus sp. F19]|nr:VanW family protein [Bacillus sp. F19]
MKFFLIGAILLLAQQIPTDDSLTITHNNHVIGKLDRNDAAMLMPETLLIDQIKLDKLMNHLDHQMYKAPVNAEIDKSGKIMPEKTGYRLNREIFRGKFHAYFFGSGAASVEAPRIKLYPRVDKELLASIRSERIGTYVTFFNKNNKQRTKNIYLAAEAINNTVIFPGETFSFNGVVGNRTAAKGYLRAPIIIRGELSEGIGGGICQVSSTLFNAIDNAGLKVIERYSHSRRVPYVPVGRDATVSWYGPDFRFTNKYSEPVLIRAAVYGASVMVTIYSTNEVAYEKRTELRK